MVPPLHHPNDELTKLCAWQGIATGGETKDQRGYLWFIEAGLPLPTSDDVLQSVSSRFLVCNPLDDPFAQEAILNRPPCQRRQLL